MAPAPALSALEREAKLIASPLVARDRVRGVEGLRGLAAVGILLFHSWGVSSSETATFGRFASLPAHGYAFVQLFFAMSAFLLFRPFAAAVLRGSQIPSLRRYL